MATVPSWPDSTNCSTWPHCLTVPFPTLPYRTVQLTLYHVSLCTVLLSALDMLIWRVPLSCHIADVTLHSALRQPIATSKVSSWHTLRSSASFFNLKNPLSSSTSSDSCLRLLPRFPVTSILPSYFSSILTESALLLLLLLLLLLWWSSISSS
jgi:hypothetical protein